MPSQADACSFILRRVRVLDNGANVSMRPAKLWRQRMKKATARSTGSTMSESAKLTPAFSHSCSLKGVASTRRRKPSNNAGLCKTPQKFVKSPSRSFATSDTPSGLLASSTAPPPKYGST